MNEKERAVSALNYIIPLLEKYNFDWCIAGGFACYVYGVNRPITDIDIDVNTNTENPEFKNFLHEVEKYTTAPLEHWVDKNYDNYNVEITYQGQVIDICPTATLKIFNKEHNVYEPFYQNGFTKPEIVSFEGLKLPLLAKELIVKNKEMLVSQRESDLKDIAGLLQLLKQAR